MSLFEKLVNHEEKIAVVGLGYVGLPLAVELAKTYDVIGFDINREKLDTYRSGVDVTNEVGDEAIQATTMTFTDDPNMLQEAKFIIVSVPTPINTDKTPNLTPMIKASETIGENLTKGSIVVYESTVYPGTTEEICLPILEEKSGLKLGEDFKLGYSPERINPGDKINTLTKIVKIVSGSDEEALKVISALYGSIIEAGIHEAESIKVAEAAKVIENAQRDINIAFMNELSMVFNRMGIPTKAVLEAAGTKWNFLKFTPGLVGGHCIGVDPYYLTYKAEQLGYHSQIVLAGRKINDKVGQYVASNVIKKMAQAKQNVSEAKVAILGITFKENVQDVRNTKVIDIIKELKDFGIEVFVYDPVANSDEVKEEYGINLSTKEDLVDLNAIVLAVEHQRIVDEIDLDNIDRMYKNKEQKVFVDVKEVMDRKRFIERGYYYWSL